MFLNITASLYFTTAAAAVSRSILHSIDCSCQQTVCAPINCSSVNGKSVAITSGVTGSHFVDTIAAPAAMLMWMEFHYEYEAWQKRGLERQRFRRVPYGYR